MQRMDYNSQHFIKDQNFQYTPRSLRQKSMRGVPRALTRLPHHLKSTRAGEKEDGPLLPETPRAGGEKRPRGACREL